MDQVEELKKKLEAQAQVIAEMEAKKTKTRDYMKSYTAAHIDKRRETQRLYARRVRAAKKLAQETAKADGTVDTTDTT